MNRSSELLLRQEEELIPVAINSLADLTQSLNDQEMYDAWTARVAATLAQLSTNC